MKSAVMVAALICEESVVAARVTRTVLLQVL
jgi:hypothetical protein